MNYETGFSKEIGQVDSYLDQDAPRRGGRLRLIIGTLLVIAILATAFFLYGRNTEKPAAPGTSAASGAASDKDDKQAAHVTVISPGRQSVQSIVNATGTLAAKRDMPVGATGEGGLVQRVLVEPGQWVRDGQVLAIIDRSVQIQQSNQLVAQISAAQAEADLAQAELNRAQGLVSRGFISQADLQRKAATRDGARARVRVAQAQLAENRARIGRLDVRAPAAGLVLTRAVEPGQVVGPGSGTLFRIAKDGAFELRAEMSEADLARMSVGVRATVTPVGDTQSFSGQIWQISPVINPQTRQGEARIALPYDKALRPGGFASAQILAGSVEAPLLPESAVQSDTKGTYVYVVDPSNKVERRDVKVGTVNEGGVSIIEGLNGNEQIILSAGGFLNPGETVVPTRTTTPKK
jgi:HlyD family secretion protein